MNSPIQQAKLKTGNEVEDLDRPQLFNLRSVDDRAALERLFEKTPPRFVHDEIEDQLGEYLEALDPTRKLRSADRLEQILDYLNGEPLEAYGTWVFYPWSSRLVHTLPQEAYRKVRTARNRYKITQPEQDLLYSRRIGIIGLSVGNSAAMTFALEGIGGSFKVADFDHLSLSNMNRLRSGVQDIGIKKTVLALREMYEIDPYLEVECFPHGVTDHTMNEFLLGGGKLDLLVEECDDLYIKIVVRERCRDLGIPVIMDTSDRGLLDIERFDREPGRPIMHGLIGDVKADSLRGLPTKDKVPIFLAIVGGHRMSIRMAASLPEIDRSIGSWPQLASAVALGGAITADAARRLLLGEFTQSGRWYVDIESIVGDSSGELATALAPRKAEEIAPEALQCRSIAGPPKTAGAVTPDAIRWMVSHAVLAPSPHNAQPWFFVWRNGALEFRHDPTHDLPSLDFEQCATWATFGAAAENLLIASRAIGFEPSLDLFPDAKDARLVCRVSFSAREPQPSELLDFVPKRTTNRRRDSRKVLDSAVCSALKDAVRSFGVRLQLAVTPEQLAEAGALMGACDRISYMNRAIHHEAMSGFRWTREEVEQHRDGLDIATMELTASERASLWLLSKWEIVEAMKRFGAGTALEDLAKECAALSSAIGLLTISGTRPTDYFRGGQALQRMWLESTRMGLALQPWTGLPYLFARVERGCGEGLSEDEINELLRLRTRYRALFDINNGDAEILLFRIGYAGPPSAVSLRRSLDSVLNFE